MTGNSLFRRTKVRLMMQARIIKQNCREKFMPLHLAQARRPAPALWDNPMGTDGFEFVEYTAPDPKQLGALFVQLGFKAVAKHRSKDVTLYRQSAAAIRFQAE